MMMSGEYAMVTRRKVAAKLLKCHPAKFAGMPKLDSVDMPANPVPIALLRAQTVALLPSISANCFEQARSP